MKKFLIFALAAFVMASCGKDNTSPGDGTLYDLTVNGGKAFNSDGDIITQAAAGDWVTLEVNPYDEQVDGFFAGWSAVPSTFSVTSNPFRMPAFDLTLTAQFGEGYELLVDGGTFKVSGTDDPNPQIPGHTSGLVGQGATVVLTPNALAAGMEYSQWTSSTPGLTLTTVDEEKAIVSFTMPVAPDGLTMRQVQQGMPFTLTTINCKANGQVNPTVRVGDMVTLVADAVPGGKELVRWRVEKAYAPGEEPNVASAVVVYPFNALNNTFVMPVDNVEIEAVMETPTTVAPPAGANILYFDGQRLNLGIPKLQGTEEESATGVLKGDVGTGLSDFTYSPEGEVLQDNAVFVKFGSIMGIRIVWAGDGWNGSDVWFNPLGTLSSDYNNYKNVPYMASGVLANAVPGYVTANHTQANVEAGKGDICRLVGLTPVEAVEKLKNHTLHSYNSGYRLPTQAEMEELFPDDTQYDAGWSPYNPKYLVHESPDFLLATYGARTMYNNGGFWPENQMGKFYDAGYYMTSDAAAGENLFRGMQAEQDFYRDLTTFYQLDKATVSYQTWKSEEMSFSVRCVPN